MRGPGMMRGPGPNLDMLAHRLNLTEDQKPKVREILDGQRKQMRDLWQNRDLSREDRMAKMRTIRDESNAKLKEVLTSEQFQKWQDMRPMMGGPRRGPGGPPPGGPPPDNGGTNAPAGTPPQQ